MKRLFNSTRHLSLAILLTVTIMVQAAQFAPLLSILTNTELTPAPLCGPSCPAEGEGDFLD